MTTEQTIADAASKASEYADGLRALAHMVEANPHIVERLSFAFREMSAPGYSYDQLDALAEVGASSADALGAVVTERVDDTYRNVSVAFGLVRIRGFGKVQKDPHAPCPTCGHEASCEPAQAEAERVSDDRVGEILAALNSFIIYETEPYTEIVNGVSVLKQEILGSDPNLDKAIDWALGQPEVSSTGGPDDNGAQVILHGGTVIEFDVLDKTWSVTVSADESSAAAS